MNNHIPIGAIECFDLYFDLSAFLFYFVISKNHVYYILNLKNLNEMQLEHKY